MQAMTKAVPSGTVHKDVQFRPVQPQSIPSITVRTESGEVEQFFAKMTREELLRAMPLENTSVEIYRVEADGKLSFLTSSFLAKQDHYKIFLTYGRYGDHVVADSDTRVRVGVGARILVDVRTREGGLDLGSIFSIGLAAKAKKIEGTLDATNIGIDNPEFGVTLPSAKDLTDQNILDALQGAAVLSKIIRGEKTILTPHIIAVGEPAKTP